MMNFDLRNPKAEGQLFLRPIVRFRPFKTVRLLPMSRSASRRAGLNRERSASLGKAAVNTPHSRRFATSGVIRSARQRLECSGFSTALGRQLHVLVK